MAKIQLFNAGGPGGESTAVGERLDPRVLSGRWSGLGAVAEGVSSLGKLAHDMQRMRDYKAEQEALLAMEQRRSAFQERLLERGDEDRWAQQWEKEVGQVRDEILGKERVRTVSGAGRQNLDMMLRKWGVQTRAEVSLQAKARSIDMARKLGEAAVSAAFENRDEAGAKARLAEMVDRKLLSASELPVLLEQGRVKMQRGLVEWRMAKARELPPVQELAAFQELGEDLRGGSEEYSSLSEQWREKYIAAAQSAQRRLGRSFAATGERLINDLRAGRSTLADVEALVSNGEFPEEEARSLMGSWEEAAAEYSAKKAANAEKAKVLEYDYADRLVRKINPTRDKGGVLGYAEIAREERLGRISEQTAIYLRKHVDSVLEQERSGPVYRGRLGEVNKLLVGWLGRRDASPFEYETVLGDIVRSPLSKEGRAELGLKLMQARLADIGDGEENVGGVFDRKVGAGEVEFRQRYYEELAANVGELGVERAGRYFFDNERHVRALFDDHKGVPPPEKVAELGAVLSRGIRELVVESLLSGTYGAALGSGHGGGFDFAEEAAGGPEEGRGAGLDFENEEDEEEEP